MLEIKITANELVAALLSLEESAQVGVLDSCGRTLGDSRYLIAAAYPSEKIEFRCQTQTEAFDVLRFLDEKLARYNSKSDSSELFGGGVCIAGLAYEFGALFENLIARPKESVIFDQPSATFNFYETFAVHDYQTRKTFVVGKEAEKLAALLLLKGSRPRANKGLSGTRKDLYKSLPSFVQSNFTKDDYLARVETIKQRIWRGDIYQANLTQQLSAQLPEHKTPEQIFTNIRTQHPAPFAAFLRRKTDAIVSASPERFLKVFSSGIVLASPIKGTRRRGETPEEDARLRRELENSAKDQAENTMIVDLLRNDIGRVCAFGSVRATKLCELETHASLFHLVSTIKGNLRADVKTSDLLKATFPCGSITGAPKISAIKFIDHIETAPRGISMGAIGYFGFDNSLDLNVAIRTMVVRNKTAVFNVGGGIVADSEPANEYEESLIKARSLLNAFG